MDAGSSKERLIGFPPQQKICAILSVGCDCYAAYIVDIASEDGAADDGEIVYLNSVDPYSTARQFVERSPNLLFHSFNPGDCLCGLGSTIFLFEGVDYRQLKFKRFGDDANATLHQRVGIYRFPLLAEHMVPTAPDKPAPCYVKSQLHKDSDMLGLKCAPMAVTVPSQSSIIIFSTEIEYFVDINPEIEIEYFNGVINRDGGVVDFEMYNTESKLSVKLPPLHIARISPTIFVLVDLVRDKKYYFTPEYNLDEDPHESELRPSFAIRAFTFFHDHIFVVEPVFGGVRFSLDIASDSGNLKWELFDRPIFFPRDYRHFMSRNDLILSSYGAHKVGYDGYDDSVVFPFPLCSFVFPQLGRQNSSIILLEHATYPELVACILQVGKDYSDRPYWTVDVVKLNDRKFEFRNEDEQFARRIKSFKFVFRFNFVSSSIVDLFAVV